MAFLCERCGKDFRCQYDLDRHLNRKTPCDAGEYKCPGCNLPFASKKLANVHIKKGRCKGKRPAVIAEELARENSELKDRIQQQEQLMQMTNHATAAACSSQSDRHDHCHNLTINIETLNVTRAVGQEDMQHLSRLTVSELRQKLNLTPGPQALADWCALLRTDEEHPENHNALLLAADSDSMACCRGGQWAVASRNVVLLELLRHDMARLYSQLSRFEGDADTASFRNEYLLHGLMTQDNSGDRAGLQKIMDAIARPIIELTHKFYLTVSEDDLPPKLVIQQQKIDQFRERIAKHRAEFEKHEAAELAFLLDMQRDMAESLQQMTQDETQ